MCHNYPKVGEVWLVNFPQPVNKYDYRICGTRPAVVIERSGSMYTVLPTTRYDNKPHKLEKSIKHELIKVEDNPFLNYDSIVLPEQQQPLPIQFFSHKLGDLCDSDKIKVAVLKAIAHSSWFKLAMDAKADEDDRFKQCVAAM